MYWDCFTFTFRLERNLKALLLTQSREVYFRQVADVVGYNTFSRSTTNIASLNSKLSLFCSELPSGMQDDDGHP
jgi:hypothetical protein